MCNFQMATTTLLAPETTYITVTSLMLAFTSVMMTSPGITAMATVFIVWGPVQLQGS